MSELVICIKDGVLSRKGKVYTALDWAEAGTTCPCGMPTKHSMVAIAEFQEAGKCPLTSEASRFARLPPLTRRERDEFLIDLEFDLDVVHLQRQYEGRKA